MASWVNKEGLMPHPITSAEEIPLMAVGSHIQHFIDCRIKKIVYEELCHVRREIRFLTRNIQTDEPKTPEEVKVDVEKVKKPRAPRKPKEPVADGEEKVKKPRAPRKPKEPLPEGEEKVKKPRAPRKKKNPVVKKLIVDEESEEDEEADKATVAKAKAEPEVKVDPVPEAKAEVKSNKFIDWSKYSAELSEEEDE
jgi:hypothetical protein